MPVLTVFLAPAGPAGGVLDILGDLSGAGLVDPFLWVDDTDVAARRGVEAVRVVGGRRSTTTVQDAVVSHRYDRIRLCVLVPLQASAPVVSSAVEQLLADLVEGTTGADVTRVRCLLTRAESSAAPGTSARQGWHNVMIAPEDSQGPGFGLSLLPPSTDPVEIGRHAAPAVAGLLGLWTGMSGSCLDDMPIPPGESIRAARSFYRRVDAGDVERELRGRVLSTRPELPLPRDQAASSVYVEDVGRACWGMSSALWAKHPHVLKGTRRHAEQGESPPIGFGQAIRWLLGFIVAALRNAPEEWYRTVVTRFGTAAAARAQNLVFGSAPAAYTVVVNGMTPDGRPAGWEDVSVASGQLDTLPLDPRQALEQEARVDLSVLWKDYTAGGLTLADAGVRGGTAMPPVQVGSNRGVLRSAADCVPTHEADFTAISPNLAAQTGCHRLQVGDVLGAEQLMRRLAPLAQDSSISADAGRTIQALQEWQSRHEHTYAAQVGGRLGGQLNDTVREIADLFGRLRAAAAEDPDAEGRQGRRRLAAAIAIGILVGIVVLATFWTLAATKLVTVTAAVIITIAVVLAWLLGGVISYIRAQQRMFQDFNRRKMLVSEVEAILANLRYAIRDLRRLGEAYGQYLLWTRVLGVVLGKPFGADPTGAADAVHITRGLPHTTRVARAQVAEASVAEASAILRRDLYRTGWLSGPWEATLADASARLGPAGLELVGNPEAIYDLQGRSIDGSPLQSWTWLLLREGTGPTVGAAEWNRVRTTLDPVQGPKAELGVRLMSSVQAVGHGELPAGPLAQFFSGIDEAPTTGQRFHSEHFTAEARAADAPRVTVPQPSVTRTGLSQVRVLVQLSDAMPVWWFRVNEATPPQDFYRPDPGGPDAESTPPSEVGAVPRIPGQDTF